MKRIALALAICASVTMPVAADMMYWTDWTSAASNSAAGTITLPGESISVRYSGTVAFAQTGTGTDYWTEGSPAPYTGNPTVDNRPPAAELIALDAPTTSTLSFSKAVINPVMAIVSLGRTNLPVTYSFNQPFSVLGEGAGYWGDGSYTLAGNNLTGYELHGVIQFPGTYDTISWTNSPAEYWHGFTVAAPAVVPAPGAALLGILGLGTAGVKLRRRRE